MGSSRESLQPAAVGQPALSAVHKNYAGPPDLRALRHGILKARAVHAMMRQEVGKHSGAGSHCWCGQRSIEDGLELLSGLFDELAAVLAVKDTRSEKEG